jgi:GH24 family phage-related lysozyme (muramidase)
MSIVGKPRWRVQTVADLARHEGFRAFPYPDPLSRIGRSYSSPKYKWGFKPARLILAELGLKEADGRPWTNGFGETKGITPDTPQVNRESQMKKLDDRLMEHVALLDQIIPEWQRMPTFAQTVLANLSYNLGTRLKQFGQTLELFKKGDYAGAAGRLRKTPWFKQVGARAEELCTRLEHGTIAPQHIVI